MKNPVNIVKGKLGDNSNRHTVLWLIIATVSAIVAIVGLIYFLVNIIRDIEIVSVKSSSNSVILSNIENIDKLNENINSLQADANLLKLVANPKDTVFDVIGDCMPNEEDATALAAMIQNNIFGGTGVTIEQVIVGSSKGDTNEIDISFTILGDFGQIIKAQQRLENSIRPIVVKSMSLSKTDKVFRANYTATTFYLPTVKFVVNEREVSGEIIPIVDPISSEIIKPNNSIFGEKSINPNAWKQQGVGDGPSN